MYKVFIVDDEVIIREKIRSHIDWESTHFILSGEASDGEMALSMIKDIKPDILVTDICMPFLNGIQLAHIVKQSMPWVRIILLSGYDEFDYAQKAISIGVQEYILKPVSTSKLLAALEKALTSIEDEKRMIADVEALRESLSNKSTLNEEKLFTDIISGAIEARNAIEQSMNLSIDIVAPKYVVIITKLFSEDHNKNDLFIARAQMKALAQADENVWQSSSGIDAHFSIIKGDTNEAVEEKSYAFAQAIMHEISRNTKYNASIAIGSIVDHLGDIPNSYHDADKVFNRLGSACMGKVSYIKDIESANERLGIELSGIQTGEQLKYAAVSDIPEILSKYRDLMSGSSMKSTMLSNYIIMDILLSCSNLIKECGGDSATVLPQVQSLGSLALKINTPKGLEEMLDDILKRTFDFRDSSMGTKYSSIIKKAQSFIHTNFADQDISLHTVSKHVALSSNHFCTIFAQETGQTFIEYLTSVRIKRAKELLLETNMRTGEVAFEVGYNDPHYFSYIFKKQTGFTPRDFRSKD